MTDSTESMQGAGPMREVVLEARVHGRTLVRDVDDPHAPLLVGFHGYGESADDSLGALQRIPGLADWRLAAIEALHPFYNRRQRAIVASWMTRRLRTHAIADNVDYVLDSLRLVVEGQMPRVLVLAGFSQGAAMTYRAAGALRDSERASDPTLPRLDGLIILAGDVPPDVAKRASASTSALAPTLLGRGTEDEWYTSEKMDRDLDVLGRLGVACEPCVFEGGHLWSLAFLESVGAFLARIAARSDASVDNSALPDSASETASSQDVSSTGPLLPT